MIKYKTDPKFFKPLDPETQEGETERKARFEKAFSFRVHPPEKRAACA